MMARSQQQWRRDGKGKVVRPMVKRKDVPVLLTVAAVGVGIGIGAWLFRDQIRSAAKSVGPAVRKLTANPLETFGTDVDEGAFEGVTNFPHMPEGWRPKRGMRD
jgi:hypothetical protein